MTGDMLRVFVRRRRDMTRTVFALAITMALSLVGCQTLPVTFVFAPRDTTFNNATALRAHVLESLSG